MTNQVMDLTCLGQFYITTHIKVDLLLIIYHLIYLIFLINLNNESF